MNKLEDNLKKSRKLIEPSSDLSDKIMKAVLALPTHKQKNWRNLALFWVTPVAVALVFMFFITTPAVDKLILSKSLNNSSTPSSSVNGSNNSANSNSGSSIIGNNSNPTSTPNTNQANSGSNDQASGTDNTSLDDELSDVGSSLTENQQSLADASTALSNQQLDNVPSN